MRAVVVRVVPVAETRWLGWLVGLAGGLATFMTTMGYVGRHSDRYWLIGLALFVWNLGMLLAWRPRPFTALLKREGAAVRIGAHSFPREGIKMMAAQASRGWSITIDAQGAPAFFVETESEGDARAVFAAAGAPWPGRGAMEIVVRNEIVRLVQRASAALGTVGGIAYFVLVGLLDLTQWKPVGIVGLAGLLSSALYVFDFFLRRNLGVGDDWKLPRSCVADHLAVYTRPPGAQNEPPSDAVPRVRVLVRGDETSQSWLSRLDAMADRADGYRGDALTRDELLALVDDDRVESDARLGAARLLARRHGETSAALERRLGPALAERALAVVVDDIDDAAARLERIGPFFVSR